MEATLKDAHGDPVAGAVVFKNVCGQCHKIYGEGQEVGPEITLNGRGSYEQLLSNVFDPSLVIGPAYQATTVATTDGRVLTGLRRRGQPAAGRPQAPGGKLETIARSAVEESKVSPLSLMPEGLESQISPKELADLFAFITLDKPPDRPDGPPDPGHAAGITKANAASAAGATSPPSLGIPSSSQGRAERRATRPGIQPSARSRKPPRERAGHRPRGDRSAIPAERDDHDRTPSTIRAQCRDLSGIGPADPSRRRMIAPAPMIETETSTGARTGPDQGSGQQEEDVPGQQRAGQPRQSFRVA